nr:uncharacterized protein LOC112424280 isoform X2 [Macaca nemestrina]
MIPALGARGPWFKSQTSPFSFSFFPFRIFSKDGRLGRRREAAVGRASVGTSRGPGTQTDGPESLALQSVRHPEMGSSAANCGFESMAAPVPVQICRILGLRVKFGHREGQSDSKRCPGTDAWTRPLLPQGASASPRPGDWRFRQFPSEGEGDFRKPESPPSSALLGPHLSPRGRHEGHREKTESADRNSLEALKKSSGRSADRTQEPGYPRPES